MTGWIAGGCLPLVLGWLLDKAAGDPEWLPHPVVGFGRMIASGERRLNRGAHRMAKGGLLAVGLVVGTYLAGRAVVAAAWLLDAWIGLAASTLLVFYCLAGTTLVREVREVFRAVDRSLEEGRRQVARIVGRDTSALTAQEIRTAALETLAENLSDGVIAPLFWYALLGVPGMLAYKMVNTLDSMIAYRNDRYLLFGRGAARLDDVANYLPARLTALLMLLAAGRPGLLEFVRRFGRSHASPNSGYPEAALAGILGCRFGGTHDYFGRPVPKPYIGTCDRPLDSADMRRSVAVCRRAEAAAVVLVAALLLWLG
ncbi:MAG: adenosylcobinamide-phosphate synthase CbiB [Alistipes sp.]|nr:adenosylcobinamide-phosphate synthase CbiB [Alistipes sp.]